jgi:signal transduction histidine kinase/CheY-like chemotaxis protein
LTTKQEFFGETYNYRKDGTEYIVEWRITPVFSLDEKEKGHVKFWVAIQRDVTERRKNEEELREADRKKDEFLATLAHELRNPLAPIRSGIQFLSKQESSEPVNKTLEMMNRQIKHIVHLVDDLLDVSRITRGKIELRQEVVDFKSIINGVIEAQKTTLRDTGRIFNVELPEKPTLIRADPTRIFQIVSNLVNNALKYSENSSPIEISLAPHNGGFLLQVKDYGIGIRAEMLNEIFNMFSQAKDVLHRAQGGLGIGLTIVKQLVEMHGGSVWAESKGEGKGAIFHVWLPEYLEDKSAGFESDSESAIQNDNQGKYRILVVDDIVDGAEMVKIYLESEGFNVACSYDGRSALSALEKFQPDAILMDIGMPGLNGYETNALIKENERWKDLPVFALTGFSSGSAVDRLESEGFAGHFVKPADLEMISQFLRNYLEKPIK